MVIIIFQVEAVPRARVPIVKFQDRSSRIMVDLSFRNAMPVYNTQLINQYTKAHPLVRPYLMVIRYWAKVQVGTLKNRTVMPLAMITFEISISLNIFSITFFSFCPPWIAVIFLERNAFEFMWYKVVLCLDFFLFAFTFSQQEMWQCLIVFGKSVTWLSFSNIIT